MDTPSKRPESPLPLVTDLPELQVVEVEDTSANRLEELKKLVELGVVTPKDVDSAKWSRLPN